MNFNFFSFLILILVSFSCILSSFSCSPFLLLKRTNEELAIKYILEDSYSKGYQKKNTKIIIVDSLIMLSDFNLLDKKLTDNLVNCIDNELNIDKLPKIKLPYIVNLQNKSSEGIELVGQKWTFSPLFCTKGMMEFIMFSKEEDNFDYISFSAHLFRQEKGRLLYVEEISNLMVWH